MQMGLWAVYRAPWVLPTFGFVAGALTNWVALALIFYPYRPTPLFAPWRWRCLCGGRPSKASASVHEPSGNDGGGCCSIQGLFIRRQAEVSAVYARIVANVIVTPRRLLEEVTGEACARRGEVSENAARLREHCRRRTLEAMERMFEGSGSPMAAAASAAAANTTPAAAAIAAAAVTAVPSPPPPLSPSAATPSASSVVGAPEPEPALAAAGLEAEASTPPSRRSSWLHLAKRTLDLAGRVSVAIGTSDAAEPGAWELSQETACDKVCELLPVALGSSTAYMKAALRLEETIRERMAVLPPGDFESLLHAVFKEDEWKLFLVGGVLGAAIGIGQAYAFQALGMG